MSTQGNNSQTGSTAPTAPAGSALAYEDDEWRVFVDPPGTDLSILDTCSAYPQKPSADGTSCTQVYITPNSDFIQVYTFSKKNF
ncbi:hypothetical protein I203_102363 [Kwoniella mangroviensis CBS 8507]|uniref:uncharacterized protein n=1 Tax=Kwoniella mangroviensis CBS 8507 TaxID=1296122 RepID=UPI00303CDE81